MTTPTGGPTFLGPDDARHATMSSPDSQGLPRDLVRQAMQRLRVIAILYAVVFFSGRIFPWLISEAGRAMMFSTLVPGAISISVALFVAAVVGHRRLSPRNAAAIAIVFEIASCYGIAAAELLQP